jgi:hypothetical protein
LTARLVSYPIFPPIAGALAGLLAGYAVVSPDDRLLKFLCLAIALAGALALTPQAFVAGTLLVFAASTAMKSPVVNVLPAAVYVTDLTAVLVAVRGFLPRDRVELPRSLAGVPTLLFTVWALVMAIAGIRGMLNGVTLDSAVRADLALFYYPLLLFGYTRVLRERALDTRLLWRYLALVALTLTVWMFLARVVNYTENDPGLANVPTGGGHTVPRNFGFASAFIVYPALALVGMAGMAFAGTRRSWWALLAIIGSIATLVTLVRGEIFSLALAAVLILLLRSRRSPGSARFRTALQLAGAVVLATVAVVAVSPKLGNAIVHRALPFTHQAQGAEQNAEYRSKAVHAGFRIARDHRAGLGVLDTSRLQAAGLDPDYPAHSGVATLLFFGGWPALVTALLTVLAVIGRSFMLPAAKPWLHAAFVGVFAMLTVYSIGAAGLAGDAWVIPLGVLAVVLRFTLGTSDDTAA